MIDGIIKDEFSSNLPIIVINTDSKVIHDKSKTRGSMAIFGLNKNGRSSISKKPTYNGNIEIKIRGASSKQFPKKQYSIETKTLNWVDDDVSLLSMPKEHKWILYAPYSDKSLMRNYIAYEKTREINPKKYYAVRSKYVELLIYNNGTYYYDGVYLLMEKIKRDKGRLNIKKLKPKQQNITGGYIIKQDKKNEHEETLKFKENKRFVYVYPKTKNITKAQKLYISTYLKDFQHALYSDDFNNSKSKNYYGRWINEESFIVHFISRELFLDVDSWDYSEFLHKDRDRKLSLSTVWDFNLGMGNNNYKFTGSFRKWGYLKMVNGEPYSINRWLERLMSDKKFYNKVKGRWKSLRQTIYSEKELSSFISKTKKRLKEASRRNFNRWDDVLGKKVWPNRRACREKGVNLYCKSFKSAVDEDMKEWLLHRARWMDKNF